jgi:hypothetical protein
MNAIAREAVTALSNDDLATPRSEEADSRTGTEHPQGKNQLKSMQREVARYIGQMSGELSGMARKSDFDLLAYFLEMARVEARALVRKFQHSQPR